MPDKTIWPCINYEDAPAAIDFLEKAFGFETVLVVPDKDDATYIQHAELRWPEGGGVMLGSADPKGGNPFKSLPLGSASIYVVTDHPDDLYGRATGAGAEVVREMQDTHYGDHGFSVRDPEGNLWSFGTYAGEEKA
jgi:uncharacterized glyoxalase superfamily protein PhnB